MYINDKSINHFSSYAQIVWGPTTIRNSIRIPMQQSAYEDHLLPVIPGLQLSVPQIRLPAQSPSRSQSPSPTLHLFDDEQHDQSVLGIPSQLGATGAMQQSAALCQLLPLTPGRQLLVPQTSPPAQSLSRSQSPFPMLH